jgi:hydroxymethylbilane synthase
MMKLVVGTRGSGLALKQTNQNVERLRHAHMAGTEARPLHVEVRIIKTKGDKILDVPLAKIGDKGLFVKELEQALLAHEVDFVVHSMKDVPTEMPDGLLIAAVPEREDPSDALISNGLGLADLPTGARIGSSSLRRRAQLHNHRADLEICDIRGNLDTRLRKLYEGEYDAIILACAGLNRMGWSDRITEKLPPEMCLPAVGQGALAIQARRDDAETLALLSILDHPETHLAVDAERALMRTLEGGCQVPIGALARLEDGMLVLDGVVASLDGANLVRGRVVGPPDQPEELGIELAQVLLSAGADRILAELRDSL